MPDKMGNRALGLWPGLARGRREPAAAGPAILDRRDEAAALPPERGDLVIDPGEHGFQPPKLAIAGGTAGIMGTQGIYHLIQR